MFNRNGVEVVPNTEGPRAYNRDPLSLEKIVLNGKIFRVIDFVFYTEQPNGNGWFQLSHDYEANNPEVRSRDGFLDEAQQKEIVLTMLSSLKFTK